MHRSCLLLEVCNLTASASTFFLYPRTNRVHSAFEAPRQVHWLYSWIRRGRFMLHDFPAVHTLHRGGHAACRGYFPIFPLSNAWLACLGSLWYFMSSCPSPLDCTDVSHSVSVPDAWISLPPFASTINPSGIPSLGVLLGVLQYRFWRLFLLQEDRAEYT